MKRIKWFILIFSILLSLSINLKLVINRDLDYFIKDFKFDFKFILSSIIISIFIYFILLLLFKLLDKIKINNSELVITKNKKILIFFSIFIPTFIYLLVYYPGVYLNDTYLMLYSPISSSNIHPLFCGLVFFSLFTIFKGLFSPSFAIFCISLIQSILSSIVLTYIVVWFNKKIKNKTLTLFLLLYFVLTPIVSNYNMALNKDGPYSIMFLLFMTLYYEIIESKGKVFSDKKFLLKLIIVSVITSYIRNNGIYIIIPSIIIVLIVFGIKKYYKNVLITMFIILSLSYIPSFISKLYKVEYLKREKYAVPIQQISYLVKYYPDRLSDDDYDLLDKIIIDSKTTISNKYNVYKVDEIKFDSNFKDDAFNKYEKDFLLLWFNKLPSNFDNYVKSYLLNTYHLWSIDNLKKNQSVFLEASSFGIDEEIIISNKVILPKFIYNLFNGYYKMFNTFINPALCFIILLLFNVYYLNKNNKNKKMFLYSIPLILTWLLLMIVSPLSSALRYMAVYIYMLPIIIFFIINEMRCNYE